MRTEAQIYTHVLNTQDDRNSGVLRAAIRTSVQYRVKENGSVDRGEVEFMKFVDGSEMELDHAGKWYAKA